MNTVKTQCYYISFIGYPITCMVYAINEREAWDKAITHCKIDSNTKGYIELLKTNNKGC